MAFPTSLDSFPSATTLAANNLNTDPHSTLHGNLGNAVAALEAKLGADSSAVTTSIDYKIGHLGGDLTGTVTAATIAAGAVTLAKHANLAANTFIGNNTASPATPMALTTTQAKALLAIANTDVSGLGTMSTVASPAPVANGGTAATTAINARTNLSAAQLLVPTAVKSTTYVAASGDYVGCDTTSAGFTVTLPTAPADGTTIAVALVKQSSTNAVTVAAGGSDVFDVAAGTTTATIALLFQTETFQYKASTSIWYRTSSRFPRSQLYASFSGDATVNSSGVVTLATVPVAKGGTGGTTATTARAGLQIDAAHTVADADYTVAAGVFIVLYTSITAPRAVTLPAANSINGGESVVVADASGSCSSTNTITTTRAGADTIDGATTDVLNVSYQIRRYISDGTSKWTADKSTFQAVAGAGITLTNDTNAKTTTFASKGVNLQQFLATGTWTKPANALAVEAVVIAAGGSGGGGRSGAAASARFGGGGGGTGGIKRALLDAADLGATEAVTVGTGPNGGGGGGTGGADGTVGTIGGTSSFGTHISVGGGGAGGAGTNASGTGGLGSADSEILNTIFAGTVLMTPQGGAASTSATSAGGQNGPNVAGAGGGGGGIDASNNRRDGGAGGVGSPSATITGGTGGTGAGAGGGNGTATTKKHQMGAGGGGGAAGSTNAVAGGNGGTGSQPGGGGGGGGAALSGGTAVGGTGGKGGDGYVLIVTWVGSGA